MQRSFVKENKKIDLHNMQEAKGGGYKVRIPLPKDMAEKGLIARYTVTAFD